MKTKYKWAKVVLIGIIIFSINCIYYFTAPGSNNIVATSCIVNNPKNVGILNAVYKKKSVFCGINTLEFFDSHTGIFHTKESAISHFSPLNIFQYEVWIPLIQNVFSNAIKFSCPNGIISKYRGFICRCFPLIDSNYNPFNGVFFYSPSCEITKKQISPKFCPNVFYIFPNSSIGNRIRSRISTFTLSIPQICNRVGGPCIFIRSIRPVKGLFGGNILILHRNIKEYQHSKCKQSNKNLNNYPITLKIYLFSTFINSLNIF